MKPTLALLVATGCLAATTLAADPRHAPRILADSGTASDHVGVPRILGQSELDRIVAGACLAGAPGPCNDTPGLPPAGLGPGPGVSGTPLGLIFTVPGFGLQRSFCFGGDNCSSSASAAFAG